MRIRALAALAAVISALWVVAPTPALACEPPNGGCGYSCTLNEPTLEYHDGVPVIVVNPRLIECYY